MSGNRVIQARQADRMAELARAEWRAGNRMRAYDLIALCADVDPQRAAWWRAKLDAIVDQLPARRCPDFSCTGHAGDDPQ